MISKVKTKDQRINADVRKLKKIFRNLDKDTWQIVDGVIKRAAFMKIFLEDLETDLNANGYTELFTQSSGLKPYERKRPAAEIYNSTIKNFLATCKQLHDLLPETDSIKADEFDEFVNVRKFLA